MHVTIRPWRQSDAQRLHELADDPEVVRWMSEIPSPYTMEIAQSWIASAARDNPPKFFAIELDGIVVGGAGIEPRIGSHRAGVAIVGYWLGRAYWGRGIATEAVRQIVKLGLAGFRRLQASVYEPNVASARVLEKCGFQLEACLRSSFLGRNGTPYDELIYGIVDEMQ